MAGWSGFGCFPPAIGGARSGADHRKPARGEQTAHAGRAETRESGRCALATPGICPGRESGRAPVHE
eukprot:6189219-Alexandrium_andersonii.AAC.1